MARQAKGLQDVATPTAASTAAVLDLYHARTRDADLEELFAENVAAKLVCVAQ